MDEKSNQTHQNSNENVQKRFKKLKLYLTGFGAFMQILTNPTSILVERVKANKQQIEEIYCFEIASADVLRVAYETAEQYCEALHSRLEAETDKDKETLHLALHFGVASTRDKITIETRAKNEFAGEDVDGVCKEGCISESCEKEYHCRLDLKKILNNLHGKENYKEILDFSHDAGSYLCNFIYFSNETRCVKKNSDSVFCVFIHMPMFEFVNEEAQFQFFLDFINEVKEVYLN